MDRDESAKNKMERIPISDTIERTELFGGLDQNLKLIEENLDVNIIQRDNELVLKGEKTTEAKNILSEMMNVLIQGDKLDEQKIGYITDLNKDGVSYNEQGVEKDIICFTYDGKPLRPKTLGQKI